MLKEILENGNIPFTDLLPNQELIIPIAIKLGYEVEIFNSEYKKTEMALDEEGKEMINEETGEILKNNITGRMEENSETPRQFVNRLLTDNIWMSVKYIIKDIMLAEQMQAMKLAEAQIEAQLNISKAETK